MAQNILPRKFDNYVQNIQTHQKSPLNKAKLRIKNSN